MPRCRCVNSFATPRWHPRATIALSLQPTRPVASALSQAITERQCPRGDYDARPLSAQELKLLEQAGTGARVRVVLLTERAAMESVLEYVVAGNTAQINDPAFVAELTAWIRFSAGEAVLFHFDDAGHERGGMRIPLDSEASWLQPLGPKPYWRGRIASLAYEFAA